MILLFDSIQAAQEIAYMLYGQWDGCNSVIISSKFDMASIQFAAKLVDAKWCQRLLFEAKQDVNVRWHLYKYFATQSYSSASSKSS